jgi:uncharacterized protein (TIGR02118 family)
MVRVQIWIRKKEGMTTEEFGKRWLDEHAPIARDGYANLKSYVVNLVTRVPEGQEAPYDGVAELTWDDREGFSADMKSEAAARGTEDLKDFAASVGLLFIEQSIVK